ncbi:hypothetical protein PAHAL_5G372100 [Panicum hallii]|uniref:Uncharacterized protein n=1 Tax=Panicum hallii TaxID=206008 RepID=A0A2T8IMH4_9POAL|nr:hypothetical protein PAHAL_5G372100 [Panicum hallii]
MLPTCPLIVRNPGISGRELIDTDTLKVLICLIRILNGIQRGLLSFHFYHVMQESQQYPSWQGVE